MAVKIDFVVFSVVTLLKLCNVTMEVVFSSESFVSSYQRCPELEGHNTSSPLLFSAS